MTKDKAKTSKPSDGADPGGAGAGGVDAAPVSKGSHVYLIDGSGYIFRAFHALPPLTRPSDGLPVGAVHGFCAMLWKLLRESKVSEAPTHIAVVFDAGRETFRNKIYPEYKAHRPPPPEELVPQFPLIRDAVRAFNVASVEIDGYEADDLIATYARDVVKAGGDVTIISSDKDLMQLIEPGVTMYDGMKGKKIGRDEVIEKFGVPPDKVIDVQSLAGNSTDNVPGVPGIGIKTAAELIKEYGDLDSLLERAGEIKQPKRREKLIEFTPQARISRELVTLKTDVPVKERVDEMAVRDADPAQLLAFLQQMEFNTLTRRIAEGLGVAPPPPLERSVGSSISPLPGREGRNPGGTASESPPPGFPHEGGGVGTTSPRSSGGKAGSPHAAVAHRHNVLAKTPVDRSAYETVTSKAALEKWIAAAHEAGHFAFDTETTGLDAYAGRPRRVLACGRAGQSLLRAGWASRRRRRPVRRRGSSTRSDPCARGAASREAAARRRERAEDRPEPEIRSHRHGAPRRLHRAVRRHHAVVLYARCRQGRARHGRPLGPPSRARLHFVRSSNPARAGRQEIGQDFRGRAGPQGGRVCRGGCRYHVAALDEAEAASCRRAHDQRLRNARAAAGSRDRGDGAHRHQGRPSNPVAPVRAPSHSAPRTRKRKSISWRATSSIWRRRSSSANFSTRP